MTRRFGDTSNTERLLVIASAPSLFRRKIVVERRALRWRCLIVQSNICTQTHTHTATSTNRWVHAGNHLVGRLGSYPNRLDCSLRSSDVLLLLFVHSPEHLFNIRYLKADKNYMFLSILWEYKEKYCRSRKSERWYVCQVKKLRKVYLQIRCTIKLWPIT